MRFYAVLCVLLMSSKAAAETTVTFALANNYEPLMASDGGIAGTILTEVDARLGEDFSIAIEIAPWARGVARVEKGDAHALVGTYYRPDVRPWIDPYSEPLLEDPVSVYCRSDVADPSWDYPVRYAGLRFGYLIGSHAAGSEFAAMRDAGDITIRENRTIRGNLQMLMSGRIDCFVEGRYSIQSELVTLGAPDNVVQIQDVSTENFYVGFQKEWAESEVAADFILAFNQVVRDMQADGTIKQILHDALN